MQTEKCTVCKHFFLDPRPLFITSHAAQVLRNVVLFLVAVGTLSTSLNTQSTMTNKELSYGRFPKGFRRLWLCYILLVYGGKKIAENNSMENLLDLFKFFPEAFEGQGSQFSPFFMVSNI